MLTADRCCTHRCEQGRQCPARLQRAESAAVALRLTEADLDRRQDAKDSAAMPLPDLLLAKGSMEGPYRYSRPATRWAVLGRRLYRAAWIAVHTLLARWRANRDGA